jgi:hypothetical protein
VGAELQRFGLILPLFRLANITCAILIRLWEH